MRVFNKINKKAKYTLISLYFFISLLFFYKAVDGESLICAFSILVSIAFVYNILTTYFLRAVIVSEDAVILDYGFKNIVLKHDETEAYLINNYFFSMVLFGEKKKGLKSFVKTLMTGYQESLIGKDCYLYIEKIRDKRI